MFWLRHSQHNWHRMHCACAASTCFTFIFAQCQTIKIALNVQNERRRERKWEVSTTKWNYNESNRSLFLYLLVIVLFSFFVYDIAHGCCLCALRIHCDPCSIREMSGKRRTQSQYNLNQWNTTTTKTKKSSRSSFFRNQHVFSGKNDDSLLLASHFILSFVLLWLLFPIQFLNKISTKQRASDVNSMAFSSISPSVPMKQKILIKIFQSLLMLFCFDPRQDTQTNNIFHKWKPEIETETESETNEKKKTRKIETIKINMKYDLLI